MCVGGKAGDETEAPYRTGERPRSEVDDVEGVFSHGSRHKGIWCPRLEVKRPRLRLEQSRLLEWE